MNAEIELTQERPLRAQKRQGADTSLSLAFLAAPARRTQSQPDTYPGLTLVLAQNQGSVGTTKAKAIGHDGGKWRLAGLGDDIKTGAVWVELTDVDRRRDEALL